MATKKGTGATAASVSSRSGTRRSAADEPKAVRVWGEAGITIAVTDDPPQFVKFVFGHERIAPDDREATLKKVEERINTFNEEVVERRAKKYRRLLRRINSGTGKGAR
jgi:hypothetical protein